MKMKADNPLSLARYILANDVDGSKTDGRYSTGRYSRWARTLLRGTARALRRISRVYGFRTFATLSPASTRSSRATKRKKPGRNNRHLGEVKYGVEIPRTVKEALEFDRKNGNKAWYEAIEKEIGTLQAMKCFEFFGPRDIPKGYQFAPLRMVFAVKSDLRRKARLVVGGHVVDASGHDTRSTVVKGISVRLLHLIADRDKLNVLCGDVGNAFINAPTKEKVYSRAGPEFGDKEGCIVVLRKALYGLRSSAKQWRLIFADYLRSLGFVPTRYDRDVWLRPRDDNQGYGYICTHVNDFMIVSPDPLRWMKRIQEQFLIKEPGAPKYYLGNDYWQPDMDGPWRMGCTTYLKEAIRRIKDKFGDLAKQRSPLLTDCHPELDDSPPLDTERHRHFQMLLGMGQWVCTIGRPDIAHAMASLSRFNAGPREGHLKLAFRVWGYLKKYPTKSIALDSRPMIISEDVELFSADFSEDYPDATEELDSSLPTPFGRELDTTIIFDSDHGHDHKTRRSITGLLVAVGRTPVA